MFGRGGKIRDKIKGVLVHTLGVRRERLGLKNTLYLFLHYLGSLEIGAVKYLELSAPGEGGGGGSPDVTLRCQGVVVAPIPSIETCRLKSSARFLLSHPPLPE